MNKKTICFVSFFLLSTTNYLNRVYAWNNGLHFTEEQKSTQTSFYYYLFSLNGALKNPTNSKFYLRALREKWEDAPDNHVLKPLFDCFKAFAVDKKSDTIVEVQKKLDASDFSDSFQKIMDLPWFEEDAHKARNSPNKIKISDYLAQIQAQRNKQLIDFCLEKDLHLSKDMRLRLYLERIKQYSGSDRVIIPFIKENKEPIDQIFSSQDAPSQGRVPKKTAIIPNNVGGPVPPPPPPPPLAGGHVPPPPPPPPLAGGSPSSGKAALFQQIREGKKLKRSNVPNNEVPGDFLVCPSASRDGLYSRSVGDVVSLRQNVDGNLEDIYTKNQKVFFDRLKKYYMHDSDIMENEESILAFKNAFCFFASAKINRDHLKKATREAIKDLEFPEDNEYFKDFSRIANEYMKNLFESLSDTPEINQDKWTTSKEEYKSQAINFEAIKKSIEDSEEDIKQADSEEELINDEIKKFGNNVLNGSYTEELSTFEVQIDFLKSSKDLTSDQLRFLEDCRTTFESRRKSSMDSYFMIPENAEQLKKIQEEKKIIEKKKSSAQENKLKKEATIKLIESRIAAYDQLFGFFVQCSSFYENQKEKIKELLLKKGIKEAELNKESELFDLNVNPTKTFDSIKNTISFNLVLRILRNEDKEYCPETQKLIVNYHLRNTQEKDEIILLVKAKLGISETENSTPGYLAKKLMNEISDFQIVLLKKLITSMDLEDFFSSVGFVFGVDSPKNEANALFVVSNSKIDQKFKDIFIQKIKPGKMQSNAIMEFASLLKKTGPMNEKDAFSFLVSSDSDLLKNSEYKNHFLKTLLQDLDVGDFNECFSTYLSQCNRQNEEKKNDLSNQLKEMEDQIKELGSQTTEDKISKDGLYSKKQRIASEKNDLDKKISDIQNLEKAIKEFSKDFSANKRKEILPLLIKLSGNMRSETFLTFCHEFTKSISDCDLLKLIQEEHEKDLRTKKSDFITTIHGFKNSLNIKDISVEIKILRALSKYLKNGKSQKLFLYICQKLNPILEEEKLKLTSFYEGILKEENSGLDDSQKKIIKNILGSLNRETNSTLPRGKSSLNRHPPVSSQKSSVNGTLFQRGTSNGENIDLRNLKTYINRFEEAEEAYTNTINSHKKEITENPNSTDRLRGDIQQIEKSLTESLMDKAKAYEEGINILENQIIKENGSVENDAINQKNEFQSKLKETYKKIIARVESGETGGYIVNNQKKDKILAHFNQKLAALEEKINAEQGKQASQLPIPAPRTSLLHRKKFQDVNDGMGNGSTLQTIPVSGVGNGANSDNDTTFCG